MSGRKLKARVGELLEQRGPSIGIVGGGLSGPFLAHFLTQRGIGNVTLLQSGGRLGGKLLTERCDGVTYEAGVSELYDVAGDGLRSFIEETCGLPTLDLWGYHTVVDGVALGKASELRSHFGHSSYNTYLRFLERAQELRPKSQFESSPSLSDNQHPLAQVAFASVLHDIRDERIERFVRIATNCDLATDPEGTNALYGLDSMFIDCPLLEGKYCTLYTIEGGLDRLMPSLLRQIDADIQLHHHVAVVRRATAGYEVRCSDGSVHRFDYVILAMPVDRLLRIRFEGDLAQVAARHLSQYEKLGHYLRATLFFEEPFWRKSVAGHFFQMESFGGTTAYDESLRYENGGAGIVSQLIGGSAAVILNEREDDEILGLARESLSTLGAPTRLLGGAVHRWIGSVSGQPGGAPVRPERIRHLPDEEENPNLLFVGDYLYDSTVNGAFSSAAFASEVLAERLERCAAGLPPAGTPGGSG